MLDAARASIRSGDTEAGLRTLDRHAARFPDGALSEERESLHIAALIESGELERATERARAFRARYPDSLHWIGLRNRLERARRERGVSAPE